jgi:hypothetical protein
VTVGTGTIQNAEICSICFTVQLLLSRYAPDSSMRLNRSVDPRPVGQQLQLIAACHAVAPRQLSHSNVRDVAPGDVLHGDTADLLVVYALIHLGHRHVKVQADSGI